MPGFINEHLRNGKLVFEILPFTHRPLITRRCSFTVVPETTPLALRILAKQLVEPLKPSSVEYNIHIDHIWHARTHTFVTTKHWGWLFLNFKRGHHVSHDKLSIVVDTIPLCVAEQRSRNEDRRYACLPGSRYLWRLCQLCLTCLDNHPS